MSPTETVITALLADLHRQVDESIEDGYGLFVGPSDIPAMVHIEGAVDIDALAAAILAVLEGSPSQSAPSGVATPGSTQAAHQPMETAR
jgi:hypothetical protein